MNSSIELTSTSSENTPLLRDSPEEPVNGNVKKFPRVIVKTMDKSFELSRTSNENTPLLHDSPEEPVNENVKKFPGQSIFTCAVVCILFTELCERLTIFSIIGNIVLFASNKDHLGMSLDAASILSLMFSGACCILPILGGWLADSKFGKYSVILFSAVVYLIGTILLPLGCITKDGKEHSNWAATDLTTNHAFKMAVYISGLTLVAFGTGGIKANVSPFGAEQISHRGPAAIQAFFNWFYWFINIGALVAYTVVVYVQQNVSYFWGYLIPPCSLILAVIIFLVGRQSYILHPSAGSVLATTLSIVKEAIKKSMRTAQSSLIVNHWLDRAKQCYGGTYSNWEVEDVKKVYRLLPIFGTFILYWTVYYQMNTSLILQGEYMDIYLGKDFYIPVASISVLDILGILILAPIAVKVLYPLLAKCGIHVNQLKRIGVGMLFATASMLCAGWLELSRVDNCCIWQKRADNDTRVADFSIFYQIPQYTLIGLSEVFTSITGYELAYTEAPKSLQGVIMGVFLFTQALGNFAGAALLVIVNAISGATDESREWYPDEKYINQGRLAYFFFLLAGLMFLNFIVYIFVAVRFKKKKESARKANLFADNIANKKQSSVPSEEVQDNGRSPNGHTISQDSG